MSIGMYRQPGKSSQSRDREMSTDMENDFRQKSVEEFQVDPFSKCADILSSVYKIFKAVEKLLLILYFL